MIGQTSEDLIASASPSSVRASKEASKPRKLSARTFDFFWRRDSRAPKKEENSRKNEDPVEIVERKPKNVPSKPSLDFFKNIKRHMQMKNLTICKSKQKTKEIETLSLQSDGNCDSPVLQNDCSTNSMDESNVSESESKGVVENCDILSNEETLNTTTVSLQNECILESLDDVLENCSYGERTLEVASVEAVNEIEIDNNCENVPNSTYRLCSNNEQQEIQYNVAVENALAEHQVESIRDNAELYETLNNDIKVKASLTEELLKLSNYGWYWGPISGNEADAKLISEPDGAFLVRDSSDDRYVLTLSFKSSGKLLHARMEHSGGLFSLCNQSESEGFSSVADLIDYSMNFSQTAVFCYSRPKYPGYPSFPVRFTKPVSRFTQVRSLQYLCRFVIRQNTRLDNIHKLPLPKTIKGYIEEAHY